VIPEVYPLDWPGHWARTPGYKRKPSRFGKHGFGQIRDNLFDELRRLGARNVVLSTDIPVRLDGLPYANRAESGDPGAAVYFQWRGKPFVIAADSYRRTWENVKAIAKTIEAMRAIERHGASQILERAVAGFTALPPGSGAAPEEAPSRPWWEVLGIPKLEGLEWTDLDSTNPFASALLKLAEAQYRKKVPEAHPDRGGSNEKMRELSLAVEQAREVLG